MITGNKMETTTCCFGFRVRGSGDFVIWADNGDNWGCCVASRGCSILTKSPDPRSGVEVQGGPIAPASEFKASGLALQVQMSPITLFRAYGLGFRI